MNHLKEGYYAEQISGDLELGEGCIWDSKRSAIHYIDITQFYIYTYNTKTKHISRIFTGDYVGCIVLDQDFNIIAAVRNKIIMFKLESGEKEELLEVPMDEGMRFNDGKCDRKGNLWVGTMMIDQSTPQAKHAGSLFCIGKNRVLAEYRGYGIPNGLDWVNTSNEFYHIDTITQKIQSYEMEGSVLQKGSKSIGIEKSLGAPDGMCLDNEYNFWIALWGGHKVIYVDRLSGNIVKWIPMDNVNITCCTFGGDKLQDLYITTARDTDNRKTGGLFCVKKIGQYGRPAHPYCH